MKKFIAIISVAIASVSASAQTFYSQWMHQDVRSAWSQGYKGQGVNIIVSDLYTTQMVNGSLYARNQYYNDRHGNWTSLQARLVAPSATIIRQQAGTTGLTFDKTRLNVVNTSYGYFASAGSSVASAYSRFAATEKSIVDATRSGQIVGVFAAGNDNVSINAANRRGQVNYLTQAVTGAPTAIFVGALERHGSPTARVGKASYSNVAGTDPTVQRQTLFVGFDSYQTGMAGTSFAAPQVSAYAAILGSKFTSATPVQITNQLLNTARTDTIRDYRPEIYGRGEASLSRALAPVSIR